MKSLWTPAILILAAASLALAAPIGICLHAYSPEAPADKIECFEFERSERFGADYRFFIDANKPAVVTSYRYRGAIPYKTGLAPGNPEFDKLLKLYEETSRATPSTRQGVCMAGLFMNGACGGDEFYGFFAMIPVVIEGVIE